MLRTIGPIILLVGLLSGCASPEGTAPTGTTPSSLHGWVLDEAVAPIPNAAVDIVGTGLKVSTDDDGHYRLDALPPEEHLTLVASAEGFRRGSATVVQQITGIRYTANFTLARVPDAAPVREVLEFRGFFSCGVLVQVGHEHGQNPHDHNTVDCGGGNLSNENVWHMPVKAGLTGAVFEVFWQAGTPFAENILIIVEGVGVDAGQDVLFSFYEGQTGMKGTVSHLQAQAHYREEPGTVRFTILPGAPDQDVAVGAHINQDYEVIATLFYGEVPPATYSFLGEAR